MKSLIILLVIFCITSFAQVITIKGKVVDSKTDYPLENANIIIKGDNAIGTISDSDFERILAILIILVKNETPPVKAGNLGGRSH